MSDKPISPLRQRMIDDMTARRFSEATQKDYVGNVRNFTAFLGRSPDTATSDDLRRFQLHMAQQQVSPWSINAAIAALRFFFTVTLERPDLVRPLRIVNEPRKAPVVLSQEEAARLLEAAPGLKYKAALSVAYGAGLRVSEVANLKVSDIDSERMTLRVEQGIRRFLLHVLPSGFHRIRHYGLLAGAVRTQNIERAGQLLAPSKVPTDSAPAVDDSDAQADSSFHRCPCCDGRMIIVETFEGQRPTRSQSPNRIRIDTS